MIVHFNSLASEWYADLSIVAENRGEEATIQLLYQKLVSVPNLRQFVEEILHGKSPVPPGNPPSDSPTPNPGGSQEPSAGT